MIIGSRSFSYASGRGSDVLMAYTVELINPETYAFFDVCVASEGKKFVLKPKVPRSMYPPPHLEKFDGMPVPAGSIDECLSLIDLHPAPAPEMLDLEIKPGGFAAKFGSLVVDVNQMEVTVARVALALPLFRVGDNDIAALEDGMRLQCRIVQIMKLPDKLRHETAVTT